jgi:hypothetical protein
MNKCWITRETFVAIVASLPEIQDHFGLRPDKPATPVPTPATVKPAETPKPAPAPVAQTPAAPAPAPVTVTQQGITRTIANETPAPSKPTAPKGEGMSVKDKIRAWKEAKSGKPATPATPEPETPPAPKVETPRHVSVLDGTHRGHRYGRTSEGNVFQYVTPKGKAPYTRNVTDARTLAGIVWDGTTPPVHIPAAKPAPADPTPASKPVAYEFVQGETLVQCYEDGTWAAVNFATL